MAKLSLDAIKIINIVRDSGSFSTAAAILHKTPSAISYRVSSLEKSLGLKLFNRNGPVVTLTEQGKKIADEGKWILSAIEALEHNLHIPSYQAETFHIAISELFPAEFFQQFIKDFLHSYPKTKLKIEKMSGNDEWNYLKNNQVDMVISNSHCPSGTDMDVHLIGTYPIICCATPSYYDNYKRIKKLGDGSSLEDCLVIKNDNFDNSSRHNISCLKMNNRLHVSDFMTQLSLVKAHCGFGLFPDIAIDGELADGSLVKVNIDADLGTEYIWAAWNPLKQSKLLNWWGKKLSGKNLEATACEETYNWI